MFIELHILQNFAPANLNRDDTGAPKDCEFGGYRRARISSQCLKRAIRRAFHDEHLLDDDQLAVRTKRLVDEVARRLAARRGDEETVRGVVQAALSGIGLSVGADGKTQYLLFVGPAEIDQLVQLCESHWDALAGVASAAAGGARAGRDAKRAGREAVPADVQRDLLARLNGGRAVDLALFGRMLADLPDKNVDAACQVAHALSTHRVSMEFDFYTAVDDLKPEDTAGADMIGTVEFNSACFYRYANVDREQLRRNLGGDQDLATRSIDAFLRAAVQAVPTGKQNSMAAQNPPSLVMAVARERGLWSLANAFVQPVRPDASGDLVANSVRALDDYWGRLQAMYGTDGLTGTWVCTLDGDGLRHLAEARVPTLAALVDGVRRAAAGAAGQP